MRRYHRVLEVIATLLVLSATTFVATNVTKGPRAQARAALGLFATNSQVSAFEQRYGLDRPFVVRYATWLGAFVRGDWGVSPITGRSVLSDAAPRILRSVILMVLAVLIGVPVAVALGVFAAVNAGRPQDGITNVGIVLLAVIPEFVLAISLILILSVWLGWLPVDSSGLLFGGTSAKIEAFVLPAATLVLALIPQITKVTRAAASDALAMPFVRGAVLRGLSRRTIIWSYVLPNTVGTLANVISTTMIYLLGGVMVIETVFGFPGVGSRLVEAIGQGDTPTVQALALTIGMFTILIGLGTDLLVRAFVPRSRSTR